MILLNFSHPLSNEQLEQLKRLTGNQISRVVDIEVDFDNDRDFIPQLEGLFEDLPVGSKALQTEPVLVVPPALNFITSLLVAELHGRMGYFPAVLRLRPKQDSLPTRYEIAEILNLQEVRDAARRKRF